MQNVDKQAVIEHVISILLSSESDENKTIKLRRLAEDLRINLESESLSNWLECTILYADGLDGILCCEEDYLDDLRSLSDEFSIPFGELNDEYFFGLAPLATHYNLGFFSGGVSVYHYDKVNEILSLNRDIAEFGAMLDALEITQKTFCVRVGVSQQAVSKWKKTKFPKWVWYALKGMKETEAG